MPGSRAATYEPAMRMLSAMRRRLTPTRGERPGRAAASALIASLLMPALLIPGLFIPTLGFAAEPAHCLSGDEQRAAIAGGKAVPLGSVIHALHRAPREVVKARLCQEPDRLIYLLTLLGRDGKVRVATVDAANGAVVGER
jgi:hypothetical protein